MSGPSLQLSGGRAYLTFVLQHPLDWEGEKQPRDAQEVRPVCVCGCVHVGGAGRRATCCLQPAFRKPTP